MRPTNAPRFAGRLLAVSIASLLPYAAIAQDGVRPSISSLSRDHGWNGASFQPGQPGVSAPTYGPGVAGFRTRVSTLRPLEQERPIVRTPTDEQGRPIEQAVETGPGPSTEFQAAPDAAPPPEAADILREDHERGLFNIGPMVFRASAGLRAEFNDNINLSDD